MMNRQQKLLKFKQRLKLQGDSKELFDEALENERDLLYFIEKITHQKVDDSYPAMKIEMFKEALERDPSFKKKDDKSN